MALPGKSLTRSWRHWRRGSDLSVPLASTDVEDTNRRFLLYGVLPLWVVPAVADWWMHRRTRIEHTTGTKESAVHALMMTEAGIPSFPEVLPLAGIAFTGCLHADEVRATLRGGLGGF